MKNLILIFLLAISGSMFAQTIRRVNNNPGITGVNVYTTIQAAHNAAVAGDIVYVEPSSSDYGPLVATKRLIIIGNGYFLDKNPNNSFDTRTSKISTITFDNGTANSVLTGIDAVGSVNANDINLTITRCRLAGGVTFGVSTNLVAGLNSRGNNGTVTKCISGNFISGNNSNSVASQYGYNCLVSNCIFNFGGVSTMTNTVVSNNVFYRAAGAGTQNLFGCAVTNNIFDARSMGSAIQYVSSTSTGNTISNNICLDQAGLPSGNGNVDFGTSTATFLIANPWGTFSTEDAPFQLISGSPAIGIGTGGTNAGAFGGSNPYILSGMPAYPVITTYLPSGVGNVSTPLQVNVTVRGNN
jgi:hypothetical protein